VTLLRPVNCAVVGSTGPRPTGHFGYRLGTNGSVQAVIRWTILSERLGGMSRRNKVLIETAIGAWV
jgi:hypothetical protein